MKKKIEAMFLGLSLADALGVPVEFTSRESLSENPVDSMLGYGTYNQEEGTWSDDSSLTFCLAESLVSGYNLKDIAIKFIQWKSEEIWTPHGEVFDIGIQTTRAIDRLYRIISNKDDESLKLLMYEDDEYTNGNGSLMRILPLIFHIRGKSIQDQFQIIREVSSLTHGHIRAAISCLVYLKLAEYILEGLSIRDSYEKVRKVIRKFFEETNISERETKHFERIIYNDISNCKIDDIKSTGYVIHTLEASFWCLLKYPSYLTAVFKAINLGEDTDTTATVVGGIAGLYYGVEKVPVEWINKLARVNDIKNLAHRFSKSLEK